MEDIVKPSGKKMWTLFSSTFYISAFTFGGGYVIIPLLKKKFVDELHYLEEEDMLNMAAIAQSAPGAIAVNAAILVGWRIMGFGGALVAILGTVLPPLIILSIISLFYASFRDNPIVSAVLQGMMAGVAAVIFDVVWTMGARVLKQKKILPLLILLGSFVDNFFFGVNVIYIILFCIVLGVLVSYHGGKTGKEWL